MNFAVIVFPGSNCDHDAYHIFKSVLNRGTKPAAKAPSANRRLNILGKRNAIRNASAIIPAPRYAAKRISLNKPISLLTIVKELTVLKALMNI